MGGHPEQVLWILNESSIHDSTNRRFVERLYGRRLDSSRSIDPLGVFDRFSLDESVAV